MSARLPSVRRARTMLALAVASIAWSPLLAQDVTNVATVAPALDAENAAAVTREIERARERGLPVAPLLDKVRQGSVMRAPGSRIRTAVAALATRMDVARAALAPSPSEGEIVAGADALSAGAPRDALREVRRATPPQASVSVPLGVLAQLISGGVPADRATTMVVRLVSGGAASAQLIALGAAVESDVAAGIPATEALDVRARGVQMQTANGRGLGVGAANAPAPASPGLLNGQAGKPRSGTAKKPKRP